MFGMKRSKYWCERCDHVCKADGPVTCPSCQTPMTNMGIVWKPGPKGSRMRHYPEGFRVFTLVHGDEYPMGFTYRTRVIGGHGYHRQQAALRRTWSRRRPGDGKMRRAA